jgi:hypothetical protein
MADTSAALKKLAEATDPLYKSLDDSQKRRFSMLSRLAGGRMEHFRGGDFGPRHWRARPIEGGRDDMEHPGEQRL